MVEVKRPARKALAARWRHRSRPARKHLRRGPDGGGGRGGRGSRGAFQTDPADPIATSAPLHQRRGLGIQQPGPGHAQPEPSLVFDEALVDDRQPAQDILKSDRLAYTVSSPPGIPIASWAGVSFIAPIVARGR